MPENIICFGQQPCGFFPKRFLVSKIISARKLQKELGGSIKFFYHDSDHDYRETITVLYDRVDGHQVRLNFYPENKLQKKYTPLYLKRIPSGWQEQLTRKLPQFVDKKLIELFKSIKASFVADFCLKMYQGIGLLEGIEVVRSSDKALREKAADTQEFFADVHYRDEIVRARYMKGKLLLHQGGENYIELPEQKITKTQKNPTRDSRVRWMQSILHCTHYIHGKGEFEYIKQSESPDITFILRNEVENSSDAYTSFYKGEEKI